MEVIKFSGEREKFDVKKIYFTVREAGGSKSLGHEAVKLIKSKYKGDVSTESILKTLLSFLKKEPGVSERYNLKRAIMSLGPSGFPFEQFFARLLEHYGFKTSVGNKIKGKKIMHEVDIIAIKDKKYMIESKYHNEHGIITKLHPALYTYARFLDLKNHNFDRAWLVTNTKCSKDAMAYAKGVGLKITAWKYPREESLQNLIMKKKLYPITVLNTLSEKIINEIYQLKIVIAKDLLDFTPLELSKKTSLSEKQAVKVLEEVRIVVS